MVLGVMVIFSKLGRIDGAVLDINLHEEAANPMIEMPEARGVPCICATGDEKRLFLTINMCLGGRKPDGWKKLQDVWRLPATVAFPSLRLDFGNEVAANQFAVANVTMQNGSGRSNACKP